MKNNKSNSTVDIKRVRERTVVITDSAAKISRTADEVANGAESQISALDAAVGGMKDMSTSLKDTAVQARSVTGSSEQLASSINELAASVEQITANTAHVASTVNETAAASQETAASIGGVTSMTEEIATSVQEVSAS